MKPDALEILKKVESGELSVEEGSRRLQELEGDFEAPVDAASIPASPAGAGSLAGAAASVDHQPRAGTKASDFAAAPQVIETQQDEDPATDLGWWKKGWLIPFWVGTGILALGAIMMGWAYSSQKFFWFYCAWLPMLGGMLVLLLSWWSQQARWVHVRVSDADGSRVAISLPLPLGLAGWALRIFGRFIPNMEQKVLDDLPGILEALAKEKGPTSVEVDDQDGSRVRVYIV